MQYTVFKPNPKNTGGLVNLRIANSKNQKSDSWEKVLFAEFVPQKTWNDEKKIGTFNHEKRRSIAINIGEAGEILHSMENKVPFQNYHKSKDRACWVKFAPFEKERTFGNEDDKGYWKGKVTNFAIGYSEKGSGVNVPLTPGEAAVLKLLLESYIKESMAIDAKESEKKFKERSKNTSKQEAKVEEEESFDEENDVPFS